jgi:DNA-binding NtrC family response regulator
MTIKVPPLRERLEDIPELVEYFLEKLCIDYHRSVGLSEAALERLQTFTWPGNVRQLRCVLEAAVAMNETGAIHAGDLHLVADADPVSPAPPDLNLESLEAWAIRQALAQTTGNNTHAAKLLGIHRDTLIAKLKKYGIDRNG